MSIVLPAAPRRRAHAAFAIPVLAILIALAAAAPAAAWGPREAAPLLATDGFQPATSLSVRPDGTVVYLARGENEGSLKSNRLVVRPPDGSAAFAPAFPGAFASSSSYDTLWLSAPDAAGNQLAVRGQTPFGSAWLAPGADPGAIAVGPSMQVTQLDLAPSGEAAAILSGGSTAYVAFRPAGPGSVFDTPRELDRAMNQRSYGVGITLDPDGGVFVLYRTEQSAALLQAYAPPGGDFGAPQLLADVPATALTMGYVRYSQSSDGHGLMTWSQDVRDNTNTDEVWAMTRAPGGLLGGKSLVADAASGRLVQATQTGITDDGTQYVAYLDANPVSGCPNNNDGDGGGVIAVRGGSGAWSKTPLPAIWPNRGDVAAIATAGNAVGVATTESTDTDARCAESDPTSQIDVRLGRGASLGAPVTVASENVTNGGKYGNVVRPYGFAVNAAGAAALLAEEPTGDGNYKRYLYVNEAGPGPGGGAPSSGGSGTAPEAKEKKPLPAPGRIAISGNKLVANAGRTSFEAACTRLPGEGSKVYCSVAALLIEGANRAAGASASAKGGGKGKAAKPRILGQAKPVRIKVGKSGKVTVQLNRAGKQLLARSRGGLKATLKVTIGKAGQTATISRQVTVVAGGKRKGGAKGTPRK